MASAATCEVRALWFDPARRAFEDIVDAGACESRFLLQEDRLDALAFENKGNKDGFSAAIFIGRQATESVTAVDQLFNSEFQGMILCYVNASGSHASVAKLLNHDLLIVFGCALRSEANQSKAARRVHNRVAGLGVACLGLFFLVLNYSETQLGIFTDITGGVSLDDCPSVSLCSQGLDVSSQAKKKRELCFWCCCSFFRPVLPTLVSERLDAALKELPRFTELVVFRRCACRLIQRLESVYDHI